MWLSLFGINERKKECKTGKNTNFRTLTIVTKQGCRDSYSIIPIYRSK